jgi:hypothetical protein
MSHRSPGYPAINLEEALDKAKVMYQHDKRSSTTTAVLSSHWNYRATSSGAKLALAALKKFGLLDPVGHKKSGQVKLSDLALHILLDTQEDSPEREKAIKTAALNPDIHRELWARWGPDIPSDATVKTYLVLEKGFNDVAVEDFLQEYKQTISFAKLDKSDKIMEDGSPANDGMSNEMDESADQRFRGSFVGSSPGLVRSPAGAPGSVLNLPVPLIGGGLATLSVPIPLTQENFEYLTKMLVTMLEGMRRALVRNGGRPTPDESGQEVYMRNMGSTSS